MIVNDIKLVSNRRLCVTGQGGRGGSTQGQTQGTGRCYPGQGEGRLQGHSSHGQLTGHYCSCSLL